jgi:uncharacterized membrane protein YdjX (TVP38/TMEM64 family)
MDSRRSFDPRAVLFPLFIASLFLAAWVFRSPLAEVFSSLETLRASVAAAGMWGPALFVALQALQVVVFFIPGELVQLAGGALFGVAAGTLLSVAGIAVGSVVVFSVSRALGAAFVAAIFGGERTARLGGLARSPRAAAAFFLLFAIPGIPKDLLCFVAGLSRMRLASFLAVSLVARLPGIVGSSVMGDAASEGRLGILFGLLGVASLLFVLGILFRERLYSFILSIATPGKGR